MCKILWRKKSWCKISCRKNNACKNKSSKIFDYLVRVHNEQRLELCGREGTGKVYNWNFKTKASGSTAAYSKVLARLWDLSLGWKMKVHSPYLPARIIPTFHHYGHELNSQIFLTIYFCTRFFLRQEILHQDFLRHKILHIYFGMCSLFAIIKNKCTNICDTNNCNAKNFDAKNDVAKINPQKFL